MVAAIVGVVVVALARPTVLRKAPVSLALLGSLLALFGGGGAQRLAVGATASRSPRHRAAGLADRDSRLGAATNLATVAVLAPVAVTHTLTRALVTGVDLGVGLTPIGSLATVLWRDAARRTGEPVPMRNYLVIGIPLSVVLVVVGTVMA